MQVKLLDSNGSIASTKQEVDPVPSQDPISSADLIWNVRIVFIMEDPNKSLFVISGILLKDQTELTGESSATELYSPFLFV